MYVTLDVTPILEIKMPEYTVFINSQEEGKAEKWYQELKQQPGGKVENGRMLNGNVSEADVKAWVQSLNLQRNEKN